MLTHQGCLPVKDIARKNQPKSCSDFIKFLYGKIFINNNVVVLSSRWRLNIEGTRYSNGEGGTEKGKSGQVYVMGEHRIKSLKLFFSEKINISHSPFSPPGAL